MADVNSLRLDAGDWVDRREWLMAGAAVQRAYLDGVAKLAKAAKQRQVLRAQGSDGATMAPRKRPRADGANGPVLAPHTGASRSYKWVRAVPGYKSGSITIYFSHGWGKILGFHARGEVRGAPVRDVIGFPGGVLRRLKADAGRLWRKLRPATPKPAANPKAPKVHYLPRGQKPSPRRRGIQVYEA